MKHLAFSSRGLAAVSAVLLLAGGGLLSGCLSRPYLNRQTFLFNVPTMDATNVMAGGRVLAIRNLQIAAPFDGRPLIYRKGEFSYVRDPYAEFIEPPAQELVAPMRGLLLGTGDFSNLVERGSALRPDTLVEISIGQLYGDFRQTDHSQAILAMRFTFFDAPNGMPDKVIFQKEYSRAIPLANPGAAALMKGWNEAFTDIFRDLAADFRPVANRGSQ